VSNSTKNKSQEVACKHCGLDDLCKVLDYGEGEDDLPEGTLKRRQYVAQGETIFRAGDPFRSIFAIKSGSFKTLVSTDPDSEQVLGFHFVGELIGTEGLADGNYRCTARALETSSICEVNLGRLEETGRSVESLQQAIISLLGKEIAFEHSLSAALIRQSGEQRIAAFIVSLSDRLAARGMGGLEFKMNMSRADIASYLGLAKETVSRILAKFQKEGILSTRGKNLALKDTVRLKQLVNNS